MFQNSLVYHYLLYATKNYKNLKQRLLLIISMITIFLYFVIPLTMGAFIEASQTGLYAFTMISYILFFAIILFVPLFVSAAVPGSFNSKLEIF